ncbi:unnamed protein product [Pedinophyceae sp. YPF-701]|nr:unnamed protein product [Pedinophyceae sp. YPF-701]
MARVNLGVSEEPLPDAPNSKVWVVRGEGFESRHLSAGSDMKDVYRKALADDSPALQQWREGTCALKSALAGADAAKLKESLPPRLQHSWISEASPGPNKKRKADPDAHDGPPEPAHDSNRPSEGPRRDGDGAQDAADGQPNGAGNAAAGDGPAANGHDPGTCFQGARDVNEPRVEQPAPRDGGQGAAQDAPRTIGVVTAAILRARRTRAAARIATQGATVAAPLAALTPVASPATTAAPAAAARDELVSSAAAGSDEAAAAKRVQGTHAPRNESDDACDDDDCLPIAVAAAAKRRRIETEGGTSEKAAGARAAAGGVAVAKGGGVSAEGKSGKGGGEADVARRRSDGDERERRRDATVTTQSPSQRQAGRSAGTRNGGDEGAAVDLNSGDVLCALCDDGGDLVTCDGCNLSFHVTDEQGRCELLIDDPATAQFAFLSEDINWGMRCPNCRAGKYMCYACGEIGERRDGPDGVIRCTVDTCGRWYHRRCVSTWVRGNARDPSAAAFWECPQHWCTACGKKAPEYGWRGGGGREGPRFFACLRCPNSYCEGCVPDGVRDREWLYADLASEMGAESEYPPAQMLYCERHAGDALEGSQGAAAVPVPRKPWSVAMLDAWRDDYARRIQDCGLASDEVLRWCRARLRETDEAAAAGREAPSLPSTPRSTRERMRELVARAERDVPLAVIATYHARARTGAFTSDRNAELPVENIESTYRVMRVAEAMHAQHPREATSLILRCMSQRQRSLLPLQRAVRGLTGRLMPYLCTAGRYTSHGRYFTSPKALERITERVVPLFLRSNDVIVDTCCGANHWMPLMKRMAQLVGCTGVAGCAVDISQCPSTEGFLRKDFFQLTVTDVERVVRRRVAGESLVMGLNPPYGRDSNKASQWAEKMLQFQPRIIVLLVPKDTWPDHAAAGYVLIHEEKNQEFNEFAIPGATQQNARQKNYFAPVLRIYHRGDLLSGDWPDAATIPGVMDMS